MTAHYLIGDVLEVARTLEPGSVDLIVSSPPFLAVRSYLPADHPDKGKEGGQQSTPGGYIDWLLDVVEALGPCLAPHGSLVFELGDTYAGSGGGGGDYYDGGLKAGQPGFTGSAQADRDALREANAAHWRSKNQKVSGWRAGDPGDKGSMKTERQHKVDGWGPFRDEFGKTQPGGNGWPRAKSKSLIPELFRLALTYGINPLTGRTTEPWILRNVITWCRPNPTPGALGDKVRPATSDIAVLTKSGKRWFDLDAERSPHVVDPATRRTWQVQDTGSRGDDGDRFRNLGDPAGAPLLDWWELPPEEPAVKPDRPTQKAMTQREAGVHRPGTGGGLTRDPAYYTYQAEGNAPPLDFWVLPPGGYSGAHYAVWPPELVRRLISLMCPLRVCRVCGEPSRRMVGEPEYVPGPNYGGVGRRKPHPLHLSQGGDPSTSSTFKIDGSVIRTTDTLGWSDCGHGNWRDGMVLDPFVGSGTTLAVASGMGRESIGIDLDERNLELARERVGMFLQ